MKRKVAILLVMAMSLTFAGCGSKAGDSVADDGNITGESTEGALETTKNLEGDCDDILESVYANADLDQELRDAMQYYQTSAIDEASEEYILGTTDVDFTDSVYSAPMMSSVAYQCVILRVSEDQDIEAAKTLLKDNADPIKWVCVEAESVVVENVGDVILYIMADEATATAVKDAFLALED